MKTYKTTDAYIASFPKEIQVLLKKMRTTIKKSARGAGEKISYGIPTFTLGGKNLVHFGGFKGHISFFPTSSGITKFKKEISKYAFARGTVKFPLDKPLPLGLITKIVKFRVKEVSDLKQKKN